MLENELIRKNMRTIVEMENSGVVHMLVNDKYNGSFFIQYLKHFFIKLRF